MALDYSKFDNLVDSDDEEEPQTSATGTDAAADGNDERAPAVKSRLTWNNNLSHAELQMPVAMGMGRSDVQVRARPFAAVQ